MEKSIQLPLKLVLPEELVGELLMDPFLMEACVNDATAKRIPGWTQSKADAYSDAMMVCINSERLPSILENVLEMAELQGDMALKAIELGYPDVVYSFARGAARWGRTLTGDETPILYKSGFEL